MSSGLQAERRGSVTNPENEKVILTMTSKTPGFIDDNGGADGARTRDLQRDRLAF